ncbi:cupin domain-containing protein [Candidatus Bipolaricaulota bacterium]|nr:cupin domain-containing protein [Candidatus Bipolaricaulota bacterium]
MDESQFEKATEEDREEHVVRPYDDVPLTELVPGSLSHLVQGENVTISFLTMKSGSTFELHSHPEEQLMIVVDGYCDEIIGEKLYRVEEGDVIFLPSGIEHGAFIRDVDCKAIDIFSPPREDYREKFLEQNRSSALKFRP